jgi:hypothetical protein
MTSMTTRGRSQIVKMNVASRPAACLSSCSNASTDEWKTTDSFRRLDAKLSGEYPATVSAARICEMLWPKNGSCLD